MVFAIGLNSEFAAAIGFVSLKKLQYLRTWASSSENSTITVVPIP